MPVYLLNDFDVIYGPNKIEVLAPRRYRDVSIEALAFLPLGKPSGYLMASVQADHVFSMNEPVEIPYGDRVDFFLMILSRRSNS